MTAQHAELQMLIERNLRAAVRAEAVTAEVLPRLEALVGHGTSQAGVRASVNHRGLVTDLELSQASVDLRFDELRTEVLASVRTAIADVQEQAAPLLAELAVDARPLDDTSVLDALDQVLRAGRPASPSPSPGGSL